MAEQLTEAQERCLAVLQAHRAPISPVDLAAKLWPRSDAHTNKANANHVCGRLLKKGLVQLSPTGLWSATASKRLPHQEPGTLARRWEGLLEDIGKAPLTDAEYMKLIQQIATDCETAWLAKRQQQLKASR